MGVAWPALLWAGGVPSSAVERTLAGSLAALPSKGVRKRGLLQFKEENVIFSFSSQAILTTCF